LEIEMNVKRAYCPDCHVLVDMHQKKTGEFISLACCKCERIIWVKTGLNWRFVKDENAAAVQPPEVREVKPEPREAKPAMHPEPGRDARPAGRDNRDSRPARTGAGRPPQDNRRGPRPAGRPEGRPAAKPEARTDTKAAPTPRPAAQPKAEAKPEAKPEAKKEAAK
jgi:hypothetical protein